MNEQIKMETFNPGLLGRFNSDRAGTTAIEYALIASGISVVILVNVNGIGTQVLNLFQSVVNAF